TGASSHARARASPRGPEGRRRCAVHGRGVDLSAPFGRRDVAHASRRSEARQNLRGRVYKGQRASGRAGQAVGRVSRKQEVRIVAYAWVSFFVRRRVVEVFRAPVRDRVVRAGDDAPSPKFPLAARARGFFGLARPRSSAVVSTTVTVSVSIGSASIGSVS